MRSNVSNEGRTLDLRGSQTWRIGNGAVVNTEGLVGVTLDDGAIANQTLALHGDNAGTMPRFEFAGRVNTALSDKVLVVSGTVNGETSYEPGAVLVRFAPGASNDFQRGTVRVTGGTLLLDKATASSAAAVNISGGQLLVGDGLTGAFGTTPAMSLSLSGSYNLGLPAADGSVAAAVPFAHTQTYASVSYAGDGAFNTGAGAITVTGTFTNSAYGPLTVQPGGTLTVNRLDLRDTFWAGPGPVVIETDFVNSTARVGRLTVGADGLNLQQRTIRFSGTAAAANFGSVLTLNGPVTAAGASGFQAVTNNPHHVVLGDAARAFDVAAGGVLTAGVRLVNAGYVPGGSVGSPAQGFVKQGAGTMVLPVNNSYTGATRVEAGRLVLGAGPLTVDRIPNAGSVVLAGGALSTAGGTAGAGVDERAGLLFVSANSTVELGTGPHVLRFSALSTFGTGGGTTLPPGVTLTVTGWQGAAGQGGTAGDIVFVDNGGWNPDTLSRVQFQNYPLGAILIPYSGGGLELVPVPEPAAVLALAAAGLGAVRATRRRILA